MANRVILDGNAFYEIDEECVKQSKKEQNSQVAKQEDNPYRLQKRKAKKTKNNF